jgi:hypothetical protein
VEIVVLFWKYLCLRICVFAYVASEICALPLRRIVTIDFKFQVATSPLCMNYKVEIRVNYSRKHKKIFN